MKLPFVSRKKYEALQEDYAELERHYRNYLDNEQRRDREHDEEVQILRTALFHKGRADDYEKLMLRRAETRIQPPFIPDQSILDVLAINPTESHNATPRQHETATLAEKRKETDN